MSKPLCSTGKQPGKIVAPLVAILLLFLCVISFLVWYFSHYARPYLQDEITDLSEGWLYKTPRTEMTELTSLKRGPFLQAGEVMTLSRDLDVEIAGAALLIRTNHQSLRVYLGENPLHLDESIGPQSNPGMALHYIPLPAEYQGKTVKIELVSPYALYAGRTSPILLGTIPSLEAYTLSASMRSVVLMAMCLLLGICILVLAFFQALSGSVQPHTLALGVFAVIWALYYVCTEYITFQFFSPHTMSVLSLGLYYSFPVPLTIFFYSSFKRYKRWMLPAVVLHSAFAAVAIALQLFGVVDLPRLLNINNICLAGLAYTAVLACLEAWKGNWMMRLSAPFMILAYLSMLYNFNVFYTRTGVVPYTYRDSYLLLVLVVLVFSTQQFFSKYYRRIQEAEILAVQNRRAEESYREMRSHIQQVGGLKHEIKKPYRRFAVVFTGRPLSRGTNLP